MASIGFLIGGALLNDLAFTGSNYLFSSISKESIDKERKRHDKAIKDLQRAQIEWAKKRQERLDYINNKIMKEHKARKRFMDLNSAVQQYFIVTGRQLEPLPPKPVLEDRLKALEMENALLKKYNEYHQVVHEIDHMSDLHVDSSFYKQSMKIDNYFKINKWIDSSIGQSTVIQQLNKKRPKLSNVNQTQNRRRYVNFENGSHFICSFNPGKRALT